MPPHCTWVFGRGASIANGLQWKVPQEWTIDLRKGHVTRDRHIDMIREALRQQIAGVPREATVYHRLLDFMSRNTVAGGRHTFITTNWDNLLLRDLLDWSAKSGSDNAPPFLSTNGPIYHLNGSVKPGNPQYCSPFLLETDLPSLRKSTFEANQALQVLLWSKLVVVVGMSFECDMDCGLLATLMAHADNTLIGEAIFVIVEPIRATLERTYANLACCFPRARDIIKVNNGFVEWIDSGMPELVTHIFKTVI